MWKRILAFRQLRSILCILSKFQTLLLLWFVYIRLYYLNNVKLISLCTQSFFFFFRVLHVLGYKTLCV